MKGEKNISGRGRNFFADIFLYLQKRDVYPRLQFITTYDMSFMMYSQLYFNHLIGTVTHNAD